MESTKITKEELGDMLEGSEEVTILDVRNAHDYESSTVKLPGAVRIPVGELDGRTDELDKSRTVVAYCT